MGGIHAAPRGLPQRVLEAQGYLKHEITAGKVQMARTRSLEKARHIKEKRVDRLAEVSGLLDDLVRENTEMLTRLGGLCPPDIDAQILEIERELILRKRVYTSRVRSGKMTPEAARRQYDTMERVLETLKGLKRRNA